MAFLVKGYNGVELHEITKHSALDAKRGNIHSPCENLSDLCSGFYTGQKP